MKTRSPQPSNSEWLTRKRLIDSMLKASGWKVVPFTFGVETAKIYTWQVVAKLHSG